MMQKRIYTSEKMQGDATGMTPWQRERMGRMLPVDPEVMSDSAQLLWLAFIFIVIMPAAVGIYWSFVR